jgi:F0F1-type ATP synthase membrane subunit b/b'
MFHLIKNIIWIVGFVVIVAFILNYFGYEINKNYFEERKEDCKSKVKDCQSELIHQGLDNAKCDFNCIDPKLIIKEK